MNPRMVAPWKVEEGEASYVVRTANGFVVSITYFDDDPTEIFNLRKGRGATPRRGD
jgi:hypothetical protein